MNTNLTKGMRGENVTQLQQMLRDAGFFTYPTNTGYFGDITEKALRDFQQSRGLPVTGQYDSSMSTTLQREREAQEFLKMTKGTAYEDVFNQLYQNNDPRLYSAIDSINNPVNQGVFMGGGTVISPDQLAKYENIVAKEVDPYYQDRAAFDTATYGQDVGDTESDYRQTIDELISSLGQDVDTQNANEGSAGTWASSARQERLNSLQNKYNQKLASAREGAQSALNKMNINRQYNYGVGSTNSNPLLRYTASIAQTGTPQISTTSSQYNPFSMVGKGVMPTQQYATKKAKTNELVQSQYYNPFANL